MNQFKNRKKSEGFSLLEILLVLAIVAALAVAAFIVYPRVQSSRAASEAVQTLSAAQADLKSIFSSGRYNDLTTAVAIQAGIFPEKMIDGTDIVNEWEGNITVNASDAAGGTPAGTARYFAITFENIPEDVCMRLVSAASSNFGRIDVGTTTVHDNIAPDPLDRVELSAVTTATACENAPVDITFIGK